ncbi:hypothetical protein GCM10018954_075430 [Kutzneria kofuensis]
MERCDRSRAAFSNLVRYETRLYNALGVRLTAEHSLSTGQYEFMWFIGGWDGCGANDLAIAVGATSKGVDCMEAAGW